MAAARVAAVELLTMALAATVVMEVVHLSPSAEVMLGHEFEEFKAKNNYSFSIYADGRRFLDEHYV